MARNGAQQRDNRNRYARSPLKRRLLATVLGLTLVFILYKYYFGVTRVGSVVLDIPARAPVKQAVFTGSDWRSSDTLSKQATTTFDGSDYEIDKETTPTENDKSSKETTVNISEEKSDGLVEERASNYTEKSNIKTNLTISGSKEGANNKISNRTISQNKTGDVQVVGSKVGGNYSSDNLQSKLGNGTMKNISSKDALKDKLPGNTSLTTTPHSSKLEATTTQILNCLKFRTSVLHKTNNKLCWHNISDDQLMTEVITDDSAWRILHLSAMENLTRAHPGLVSLDVGCGTGVFTLLATKHVRRAVAVDQHLENLNVIQRVLMATNKLPAVRFYWYKLSNVSSETNTTGARPYTTSLDIIANQTLQPDDTVFMSLSQDGYELEVLLGGKRFFNTTRVCFVLVNFSNKRTRETGPDIVKIMRTHGLYPFKDMAMKKSLIDMNPKEFESGVVFRGNSTDCLPLHKGPENHH